MEEKIKPLEWKRNPVYILGIVAGFFLIVVILLFYLSVNQTIQTIGIVVFMVFAGITILLSQNQCSKCKRVFCLKKVSDDIIKEWKEPKQYNEKTIYYYSDGMTRKDIKNGKTKSFIARFERHKEGFNCKKCNDIDYKIKDIFVNRNDWKRVTTPNKVTTSTKKPMEHHTNVDMDFGISSFEPTYYKSKSGKRKTIPKTIKMDLWKKYNGKKYNGNCFVCNKKIDTHHFEAGHVKPVSKGGSDRIDNLRPICFGCNRSMGNMDLYNYKRKYHS